MTVNVPGWTLKACVSASLVMTVGCASRPGAGGGSDLSDGVSARDHLALLMDGTFTSERQAGETAELPDEQRFLDIVVRMERIDAWDGYDDAIYLYLEQAVAQFSDRPYRQRVYKLEQDGPGRVTSTVLWFPDDEGEPYIGAWRDESLLDDLDPSRLEDRGCVVELDYVGDERSEWVFVGSTRGEGCPTTFRGAVRSTSDIQIGAGRFQAWDRGWNDADEQVWGPTAGPYVFDRAEAGDAG